MRKALLFITLLWSTAAFGQWSGDEMWFDEDYARWQLLRSGRGGWEPESYGGVKDISNQDQITVSLMLPLQDGKGGVDKRFGEFYRGALLALEELREQGGGARIKLFNTPRDKDAVAEILASYDFEGTDIIIGPVYADGMEQVAEWARAQGVAVISPLTVIDACGNEVLYQMAPAPSSKYNKIEALLTEEGTNVVYVGTAKPDIEMDSLLLPRLENAHRIPNGNAVGGPTFEKFFDRRAKRNIFVVSCLDAHMVDGILGDISSMYSEQRARGATSSEIRIVGNASWARFSYGVVDRELYYKLGVCYVTNYHVDRTNPRVKVFDARYIREYGDVPPSAPGAKSAGRDTRVLPYAYRGYDAVKLFVGAAMTIGDDFAAKVNAEGHELLQVAYRFEQSMWGDWQNVNWPLVTYRPDYRIVVE